MNRKPSIHPVLRPVALAVALLGPMLCWAQLPTGFERVHGDIGAPQTVGNTMTLQQSSGSAIVDWAGFSIGAGNTVQINQSMGAGSVLLNRVTGNGASEIAGSLLANGQVFLVNPNGVLFGAGAQISVGGLVASTLDIRNEDFLAGRYVFGPGASGFVSDAQVANAGSIRAAQGATVALLGQRVENTGQIVADGGTVALAAARQVELDFHGDGLTTFRLEAGGTPLEADVFNSGLLQADGGRVAVLAHETDAARLVVSQSGVVRARSLEQRAGEIVFSAGDGRMGLGGTLDASALATGTDGGSITLEAGTLQLLGTQVLASGQRGGTVTANAQSMLIDGDIRGSSEARISVDGVQQGGTIGLRAGELLALDRGVQLSADTSGAQGDGGRIDVISADRLHAYGQLSARGGAQGGNGGLIETSAAALHVDGIGVDASAGVGRAGTWRIDPHDITIRPGNASGDLSALTGSPPLADTVLQDGDLSAALNGGTSVSIGTGDAGTGDFYRGDIVMYAGTRIVYDQARGQQTLQLQAHRSVRSDVDVVIESTGNGGPLHVIFEADANGGGAATGGGQVSYSGDIHTNGGDVRMSGAWANPSNHGCSVCLDGGTIDTRQGRSDAGEGGAVVLQGHSSAGVAAGSAGVYVAGVQIQTSTGDVLVHGSSGNGSGVWLDAGAASGAAALIGTGSGALQLRGRGEASTGMPQGQGVVLASGARLAGGAGLVDVAGYADGAGLVVDTGSAIAGDAGVVLRAGNGGGGDAIVLDGTVRGGQWVNLRPGAVDAAGAATDAVAAPIRLEDGAAAGFALSAAELERVASPELVIGSDGHQGTITVASAVRRSGNLSLQNTGAADILLQAPLQAERLTLAAGRDVRQNGPQAGLQARDLVVRAGGSVALADGGVHRVERLAAEAGAALAFASAGPLQIVDGTGVGVAAAAQQLQPIVVEGLAGQSVQARTEAGNLSLLAPVRAAGRVDLVAAGTFQNPAAVGVQAGSGWRIWAGDWQGEQRGGLSGTGARPNLYGCSYLGTCSVSLPADANTFIYARQPLAVITIGDASRPYGQPDPAFGHAVSGLVLGDTGQGITGTVTSTATQASPPGRYAIEGSFQSAEGYLLRVDPGVLLVRDYSMPVPPDVIRQTPDTYLYDRNIVQAPICLASSNLLEPRSGADGDVLAREWARVRARPHLSNCVAVADERNGCADF
ncbi:filamentous hemagglutinin N-terminal domain-containing protein [Corticibacter populi]|nr:filamentous hemagglutinin N-terminal domain-containing protein [Corticibacter populi]RZS33271.1 filamentous hemagglutinin family protein [Corticibacter populi]